jgi:hypothetical protein
VKNKNIEEAHFENFSRRERQLRQLEYVRVNITNTRLKINIYYADGHEIVMAYVQTRVQTYREKREKVTSF